MTLRPDAGLRPTPFYPILPDADWIARLVPLGIRTAQLRFKGEDTAEIQRQIARALDTCRAHGCTLIINDHWQAAIDAGATHVHLGQEDLATADRTALAAAGINLGLSTHDSAELDIALAARPDAIALGPIYATTTKSTGRLPQGLGRIAAWRRRVGPLPLIGIGGITLATAPAVLAAGADSVAVVSDVTGDRNPEQRVADWLAWERSVA